MLIPTDWPTFAEGSDGQFGLTLQVNFREIISVFFVIGLLQ